MGYTQCIGEIYPTPAAMVKTKANLVFARRHLEVSTELKLCADSAGRSLYCAREAPPALERRQGLH